MKPLYVSIIVGWKDPANGCQSEEDEKNFATAAFVMDKDNIKDLASSMILNGFDAAITKLENNSKFIENK